MGDSYVHGGQPGYGSTLLRIADLKAPRWLIIPDGCREVIPGHSAPVPHRALGLLFPKTWDPKQWGITKTSGTPACVESLTSSNMYVGMN